MANGVFHIYPMRGSQKGSGGLYRSRFHSGSLFLTGNLEVIFRFSIDMFVFEGRSLSTGAIRDQHWAEKETD